MITGQVGRYRARVERRDTDGNPDRLIVVDDEGNPDPSWGSFTLKPGDFILRST